MNFLILFGLVGFLLVITVPNNLAAEMQQLEPVPVIRTYETPPAVWSQAEPDVVSSDDNDG